MRPFCQLDQGKARAAPVAKTERIFRFYEYRAIVPEKDDAYGMCRSAEHLPECLAEITGADVEVIRKSFEGPIRKLR